MFDGGEQFHQFIASSRTSLPIPLSFPLHGNPSFDPYAPPLHHPKHAPKYPLISTNLALESDRSMDPWSNDELLALLKVRSSMEIWFPDFTWEHVSRKLGELGFKRSGEECKEKLEEESRHFNNSVSVNHNKSYRILSELDEFYHAHEQVMDKPEEVEDEDSRKAAEVVATKSSSKKRKRRDKLEMLKGFCETVVNKMMAKQEELHEKLIHDIVKRDEEKIAREEKWKNQEMDRIKTEMEIRSKEQKCAAERQATIIKFLKRFTSHQEQHLNNDIVKVINTNTSLNSNSNSNSSASLQHVETPSMVYQPHQNNPTPSFPSQTSPNPSSPSSILAKEYSISNTPSAAADHETVVTPPSVYEKGGGGDDIGKRWPRDEVLALINLRCNNESKEGSNPKGPLWERISQGMMEMGYKRNAKRCKEKWENINKYFRKTKDSSKKRSVNSRTCPYFHQLSCLYSDGTIVAPNPMQENH